MADLAPFFNENSEQIGWQRILDGGHIVVTDLDDSAILAGLTPDGEVVDGTAYEWTSGDAEPDYEPEYDYTEPDNNYLDDQRAHELDTRLSTLEQQLFAPEPEHEEAYTEQELRDLEWQDAFRRDLANYEHDNKVTLTDRQVHQLMPGHYHDFINNGAENTSMWKAAADADLNLHDLDTRQGRVDHYGEALEDADRANRGVVFDERGERRATEYPDTNEGRTNFMLDRMAGFVDADGQSLDGEPDTTELE